MSEKETAEIEISGASITGTVKDAKTVAVGSGNTQTDSSITAGQDVLQQQYDQRTELRDLDQRKDNRQYDQRLDQRRYEQRYDSPAAGSNLTFQNQDNAVIWQELRMVSDKVADVKFLLDDIPNRVRTLEVQVKPVPVPIPVPLTALPLWAIFLIIGIASLALALAIERFF